MRTLLVLAAAIHVWVTLRVTTPLAADEHFQILEFAWARSGLSPLEQLPWEWSAQIRSSLQPTVAMGVLASLRNLGFDSPFLWNSLLRLGSLALGGAVLLKVAAREAPSLDVRGRRALWLTTLFLWIGPILLGRFTSENLAGLTLALGIVTVENSVARTGRRAHVSEWGAGLLFGLSFLLRFQVALAIAPVLAWVATRRDPASGRYAGASAARIALVAAVVMVAGNALDGWFYGTPVFTPWRYASANLLEGGAASFGTSPWYAYLTGAPLWLAPPLGTVLVLLAAAGALSRPVSPWTWSCAAFVLGHSLIGHKEPRFLLPLLYALPLLVARGVDVVKDSRASRWIGGTLVLQNALLLALVAVPALHRGRDFDPDYRRWLWGAAERHPQDTIYVLHGEGTPYEVWGLETHVYRHPRVKGVPLSAASPPPSGLAAHVTSGRVLHLARGGSQPLPPPGSSLEVAYSGEGLYHRLARSTGGDTSARPTLAQGLGYWSRPEDVIRLYRVLPGESAQGEPPRDP